MKKVKFCLIGAGRAGMVNARNFEFNIAELINYDTAPSNFEFSPESGTGHFVLSDPLGNGAISAGDSILINYRFNPSLVELTFSDLNFSGETPEHFEGILNNIVTTQQVPEPATLGLLFLGGLGLLRYRRGKSHEA